MRPTRQTSLRCWPFWLLIAAWVCANTPQAAMPHVLEWIKGAEHFSHEAELKRSVAALMENGPPGPFSDTLAATPRAPLPVHSALPSPSADLKKIDLGLAGESASIFTPAGNRDWPAFSHGLPDGHVADVPHTPPRVSVMA